jgi:hypothetical protein
VGLRFSLVAQPKLAPFTHTHQEYLGSSLAWFYTLAERQEGIPIGQKHWDTMPMADYWE